MVEFARLEAAAIAPRVASGEWRAAAVIESSLARIEQREPDLAAFLALDREGARARAAELDRRRDAGERLGRLAGVPFAVKDNLAVAGRPLTCGSRALAGFVAPTTATAVERCLAEDAVLVGQTNMDEFAMGSSCENSAFQRTRNPWNRERVPGGSSGGSAAIVAAGAVPFALGSDTGGSVRQPAAFCGVVGLKPSYGRISRSGLVAFASSLDQIGTITRSVTDAALLLEILAGVDERDATTVDLPVPPFAERLESGLGGIRIGILDEIRESQLEPAAREIWRSAVARLEGLGASIHPVSVPGLESAIAAYYVIATAEASANLARFDGIRYGGRVAAPTLRETYAKSRGAGFGSEVKRRIMLGTHALSSGYYEEYYGRARDVVASLRREFDTAFERVDLIATPTTPGTAFPLGDRAADPLAMYLSDVFTTPANLAALPAIALPSGLDADGLPFSLQLMADRFQEVPMLAAARAFERDLGFEVRPALEEASDAA
ncbi:MAG: Asp-tRNA(Asn)/Glu-tRNA(Gln) amidotransferase subunit GatA [Thermoanaerobaculia bacterium]